MTPPYLKGTPQAPKVVYNHAKVSAARNAINAAIFNNEFAKIERMHDEFLSQKLRAADGTWMVQTVQNTFDALFMALPEAQMAKVMDAWQRAIPDSKLRPVIEASRWQRLAKATAALEASAEAGKDSPIWYWVALIVAGSSGRPAAQFDALFEEAVAKFPSYQPLYYTRVNYLLPQWGGDFHKVDDFVGRAVTKTAGEEGESFYVVPPVRAAGRLIRD